MSQKLGVMASAVPRSKRRAVRDIVAEEGEKKKTNLRFFTVLWVGYMEGRTLTEKSEEIDNLKHL